MQPRPELVTVVATKQRRNNSATVQTDDGEKRTLPDDVVVRHGVFAGARFPADQWQEILRQGVELDCYRQLLRLLARRAHAESEIRRKLFARKYPAAAVHAAVDKARDLGLLDDLEFARQFVSERIDKGGVGRIKIAAELAKRGVERQLANQVLDEFPALSQMEAAFDEALRAGRAKYRTLSRVTDPARKRSRLVRFLAGRGFPYSVCRDVAAALMDDDD